MAVYVLLTTVVVVAILVSSVIWPSQNKVYSRLADRYHGKFTGQRVAGSHAAVFHYGSTYVTVHSTTHVAVNGARLTNARVSMIQMDWPYSHFECEITPSNMFPANEAEPALDLRSNNHLAAQRLLTTQVKTLFGKIDDKFGIASVSIHNGILYITLNRYLRDLRSLSEFVRLSLKFFSQAQLASSPGIDIADDAQSFNFSEITCRVCGDEMLNKIVFCRKCGTPHHQECWKYTGQCSVYGCGEIKYAKTLPQDSDLSKVRDG